MNNLAMRPARPDSPWLADLGDFLHLGPVRDRLAPEDWLALAVALRPDATLDLERALTLLVERGWFDASTRDRRRPEFVAALPHVRGYRATQGGYVLVAEPRELIASARSAIYAAVAEHFAQPPTQARTQPVTQRPTQPRTQPVTQRRAEPTVQAPARGARVHSRRAEPTSPRARRSAGTPAAPRVAGAARKPTSTGARQLDRRSEPADRRPRPGAERSRPGDDRSGPGAERPKPVDEASVEARLPAPPPARELPVRFGDAPAAALASLLRVPGSGLADLSLALRAHTLAGAERFNDLIGLASLRGVDSHAYQAETVRRVLRVLRGRALLADEVGLGKTIEALMILREYQLRGMARRVLVLVPPALVHHWRGELQDKGGLEVRTTLDAALRREPEAFWGADGIVVASLALARTRRNAEVICGFRWDMVIVDEAHHAKNRATLAWQLVNGIESRFLLLLTATPVETDLEELYNLVTLLRPGQFATPAAFRQRYVDPKDPTSPKNRELLRSLLAEVMVRNTRARSGLALPPRFVTTVAVEPTPPERQLYDGVVALVRDAATGGKARLAGATLLLAAGSSPKALEGTLERLATSEAHDEALRDAARGLLPLARSVARPRKDAAILDVVRASGEQVLVFTRFRRTAEHLCDVLREAGVEVTAFHGGMDTAQKQAALEGFRAGARCLVATDVGGEGQNLQFCHVLINYDLPWNPMAIEQRIGRLHRMGQTEPVRVLNFCARGTAEELLLDVLHDRLHMFELVVGEMDMVLGNLADDRDLEERILALYAEARSEPELRAGFDAIERELGQGRARYEVTRALDTALFGEDFET